MKRESFEEPIDGSIIQKSLLPDTIGRGEIEAMHMSANAILRDSGITSNVNGAPAEVSLDSAPVTVDNETYYARVFRISDENVSRFGVVLDKTPEVNVFTPNPFAIEFKTLLTGLSLVADGDLEPSINDPEQAELVATILTNIGLKSTARRQAELEKIANAEGVAKTEKRHRREARHENAKRFVTKTAKTVGVLALVGSLAWGASKISWEGIIDKFDERYQENGWELQGGAEIQLGAVGAHPEFSQQLYDNEELSESNVSNIMFDGSSSTGSKLAEYHTIRDVVISSTEADENCKTANLIKADLDDRLVAWTDSVRQNGTNRADEITIDYSSETAKICWNGQKENEDDKVRVVLGFRALEESKPR